MTEGVSKSLSPVGFGLLLLITMKQYSLWGRHRETIRILFCMSVYINISHSLT